MITQRIGDSEYSIEHQGVEYFAKFDAAVRIWTVVSARGQFTAATLQEVKQRIKSS